MPQPIPKKLKEKRPELVKNKTFNTLLVDGSNILEIVSKADRKVSPFTGKVIGGIFSFLLQIKIMLQKANFRYVYVFWDGPNSGQLRHNLYSEYKANRDKEYDESNLSDYMKEVNARVKAMEDYFYKKRKKSPEKEKADKTDKEIFHWQRDILIQCLDELCIRQCLCPITEADDLIGYYVAHKRDNEKIVIETNDMDMTQLISDTVIVYRSMKKSFVNSRNYLDEIGIDYRNILLKKTIIGDTSDNIKGIKGVGEPTLMKNFPELKERKVTLDEIISKARLINEERAKGKKKPLKWAENIYNRVTDGVQGTEIYNINNAIIDLHNPLMTDEAKQTLDDLMYAPMDCSDRNMSNLYTILKENGVDDLMDQSRFGNFFMEFQYLIDKEKNNRPID